MKRLWVNITVIVVLGGLLGCSYWKQGDQSSRSQHHVARGSTEPRTAWQEPRPAESSPREIDRPWHLDLSLRTAFPRLNSIRRKLKRRMDGALRSDFLRNFRRPRTPLDRRSDLGLTTVQVGLGRAVSDRVLLTVSAGALAGGDQSHQRLLNSNLSVRFRYAYYFTRLGAEFYPWGLPPVETLETWGHRFRASRFYVASGIEVGFMNASGSGDFSLAPFKIYKDSQRDRDWLVSLSLGGGWVIPLEASWSLNLAGDYVFHLYRSEDFNGWVVTTGLRYRF